MTLQAIIAGIVVVACLTGMAIIVRRHKSRPTEATTQKEAMQ